MIRNLERETNPGGEPLFISPIWHSMADFISHQKSIDFVQPILHVLNHVYIHAHCDDEELLRVINLTESILIELSAPLAMQQVNSNCAQYYGSVVENK